MMTLSTLDMRAYTEESGIRVVDIYFSAKCFAVMCPEYEGALSQTNTSKKMSFEASYSL